MEIILMKHRKAYMSDMPGTWEKNRQYVNEIRVYSLPIISSVVV